MREPSTWPLFPSTGRVGTAGDGPPQVEGYEVGRVLGRGGSSTVWWAREQATGETVALKVLHTTVSGDVDGARRLEREAGLLTSLRRPHLLAVRALTQTGEDEPRPVLVLDHAPGGSLGALVRARGQLDPGEVVTVLVPVAGALADLHGQGLVHGDVAPGNVLLAERGRPVLADLGIAELAGCGRVVPTVPIAPPGDVAASDEAGGPADVEVQGRDGSGESVPATPGYVAPERLRGEAAAAEGDVHGLGAVAWYALTGREPGRAPDRPPLVLLAPDAPRALVELVEDCLEADPGRRPRAEDVAARAFAAVAAEPVRLVPTDPLAAPSEVITHRIRVEAARSAQGAPEEEAGRRPGRRAALLGAGVVGVGALTVTAVLAWPSADGDTPRATAATTPSAAPAATAPVAPTPPATAPTAAAPASTPAPTPQEPEPDPFAALTGEDPAAAVPDLAALRATAFAEMDGAALARADAAGSPALAQDQALLSDLSARGVRLEGLAFDVVSASAGPVADDGSVPVAVQVRTGPHRVVDDSGAVRQQVPASEPVGATLLLERTDGTWRVREVA